MNTVADALVPSVAAFPANIEQFASVLEIPRNSFEFFIWGHAGLDHRTPLPVASCCAAFLIFMRPSVKDRTSSDISIQNG